jgi:hypothetical protein
MLVVVEDGNREPLLQLLLDVEAAGRLDVLEVDAADGRLEELAEADDLVRIGRGQLEVEHVDVGETLEEDALPLHHRLGRLGPDVAEAEDRGAVGDDGDEVAPRRVPEDVVDVLRDGAARLGDPGTVGERQIALRPDGLGGHDRDLPRPTLFVILECFLLAPGHFLPERETPEQLTRQACALQRRGQRGPDAPAGSLPSIPGPG